VRELQLDCAPVVICSRNAMPLGREMIVRIFRQSVTFAGRTWLSRARVIRKYAESALVWGIF
jgi:hypothetical protein